MYASTRIAHGACRRARSVSACLALLALLAAAGAGMASEFSLNPTRVHLDHQRASETLTLRNAAQRDISFEVEIKRWRQGDDGEWELTPDDSLVVHPLIVTLPAGGEAKFRVGTLAAAVAEELAYRVELQQLPAATTRQGPTVELLTRMSIPVFVQPALQEVAVELARPRLETDAVLVDLVNRGDRYIGPQQTTLRLLDSAGVVLHEDSLTSGYVLAGASLPLSRPLPPGVCGRTQRVELVLANPARIASVTLDADGRQCGL